MTNLAKWRIFNMTSADSAWIEEAAQLLIDGFHEHWPEAWPTIEEARATMEEATNPKHICRVALDATNQVIGWIGGLSQYDGLVWELHPLVVKREYQGQGVGRALVEDLERLVAQHGGLTILLGTDDEAFLTTLGGADLYTDLYQQLAHAQNRSETRHPFSFYQRLGYKIVGVIPDANGRGKPDILMAKRIEPTAQGATLAQPLTSDDASD